MLIHWICKLNKTGVKNMTRGDLLELIKKVKKLEERVDALESNEELNEEINEYEDPNFIGFQMYK
jgi:hypothetical protein